MKPGKRVLAGGAEVGARMRALDWTRTPLGPVEDWPLVLRLTVIGMLDAPHPVSLFWGPELIQLYNDSYLPILGDKHPEALARPARHNFAEIWEVLGPMFDGVVRSATAKSWENQPFFLKRWVALEETYFTFSLTPLRDEHGGPVGVHNVVNETTRQVLAERRARALRELDVRTEPARGVRGVLDEAQAVLAHNGRDVPFALLYGRQSDTVRLLLCTGLGPGGSAAPEMLTLGEASSLWPLAEVLRSGEERLVEVRDAHGAALHAGPWPEPVGRALLLPLSLSGGGEQDAVLVLGVSPRLPLNDGYRDFLRQLTRQLAAEVVRVRFLEETRRTEQLAELDQVKTAFFSSVSHEFRTPLTLMLGPTEAALASPERALGGEELERVHRNALRLLKLVNALLDFNHLGVGKARASLEPVDLAALTAGLASAFEGVLTAAGLRLTVDCPPLPAPVWVDTDQWEKIVLNLLSNAFKFTPRGGISVRLRVQDGAMELRVQDTGTGIPREEQSRIFERFHRVEGARGRGGEGSGIGLTLVRELVGLHGGDVSVESMPGRGSTFTVRIPPGPPPGGQVPERAGPWRTRPTPDARAFVHEAEQWLAPVPEDVLDSELPPAPLAPSRGHVLLADDNADMRDYLRRILAQHFTVEAVADGRAALAAARARLPDVVILDVMMPGMDGFELVRALKAAPPTAPVPILLLSARAGEEATVAGLQAGVEDYLVKPFSARELLARLEAVVTAARARAERERLLKTVDAARHRLARLIENAPAFICVLSGPQHVYEMINPRYQQLVGVGRRLLGVTVEEALPETVEQGFVRLLDEVYRTGVPFFGNEMRLLADRRGDGQRQEVILNLVYQPRLDADGQVEGIDVFGFEVTEQVRARRQAEAFAVRLLQSEERQRRVVEAAGAGLWELDDTTGLMTADPRMVELMGLPPGPVFAPDMLRECVHPEDREPVHHALLQAMAGEEEGRYFMVFRIREHEGVPERWVESRAQRLLSADGRRVTLAGVMLDITERKRLELFRAQQTRLHALSARMGQVLAQATTVRGLLQAGAEALVDSLRAALVRIWLLDSPGHVLELQASAGLPPSADDAEPRIPMGPHTLGRIVQEGQPLLSHGLPADVPLSAPDGGQRERPVAFAGYPLRVGDKRVGVVALVTPHVLPEDTRELLHQVSDSLALGVERLRAEEALRTRVDFEQKLVGIVSHDLRNPLSAILLISTLLSRRETLDERTLKSALRIQSSAERATRLVKDLLDFTQARLGGGIQLKPRPASLHELTRAVVEEVELTNPTRHLDVRHEGSGQGTFDVDRLSQVVQNLVTNALKYSPEGSPVAILTRGDGDGVLLSVSNGGPLIAADKLAIIFEPMQRATAEVDQVGRSVGLGLYIVKSIVQAHGGSVSVVSTPAEGTVFTVRLPRAPPF